MAVGGVFKCIIYLYITTCICIVVSSYKVDLNYTRIKRAPKKCNGFRCVTTGKCIKVEKRCDGRVDCQDGSDEFSDCKNEVECPGYLYTCDYGACIEQDKVCDGKKDCRDNSDESHCIHVVDLADRMGSNCKSNEFECFSGQCISLDDKCNGITDCADKSDEIKETCLNMNCPGFTFVCDYGACVDGYAECDGIKQCVDNSDENGCKDPLSGTTPITVVKPVPTVVSNGGSCILPNHPEHGKWEIQGGAKATPESKVQVNTILKIICEPQYLLSSENSFLACIEEGWTAEVPTCQKKCPTLYTTEITEVNCYNHNKATIKCDSATDGSRAEFRCAPYYESADHSTATRFCWDGMWNLPPPQCIPVCGEKRVTAEPLIVNGQTVEKGDYPWVTAIFQKVGGDFMTVCGGSMLTQRVIITAAHCVTSQTESTPLATTLIKIAVGKYYNHYLDPRDTQAQYSDVIKVLVHNNYRGESQRYASDIAFLITKDKLLLSKVVQPVCYQNLQHIHLQENMEGVVTGWGFTSAGGSPSEELKEITIPYKDEATCTRELPQDWVTQYLTYDKFCAGHFNKSVSVCKGDSGGGLVFPYHGRYYIHGLVSVGKRSAQSECDIQLSALYTKIEKHYDWLEEVTSQYK